MFKGKTPLLISAVLGLLAAFLSYQSIDHAQEKARGDWVLVPVLVVNQDVMEGTALNYDKVSRTSIPERFVTPSVVTPAQFEKVVGQQLMVPLQRGDLVMWNHFRAEDSFESLSSIVTQVGRAISLGFAGPRGVAGWVRPADHVDILGTFIDPKDGQMVSVTLLENVLVLATGKTAGMTPPSRDLRSRKSEYTDVTLMVLPEEAEILALAAELGSLRLTLRNPESMGVMDQRSRTTLRYLLTGERQKEMNLRRKRMFEVLYPSRFERSSDND